MYINSPLVDLTDSEQILFDEVHEFLCHSLNMVEFNESESNVNDVHSAQQVLNYLEANEYEDAYELLFSIVKENNLSDILFLGLAVTNFRLDYLEAAQTYASQASKLHNIKGDGSQAELLDSYSWALSEIVEDWKNRKCIVNDRFTHLYPTQRQIEQTNAVDKYIMDGLTPAKPFITKSDRIATIGSCFSGNVSTFLRHNGFDVPILNTEYTGNLPTVSFSDEVFNTYILRHLFELVFGEERIDDDIYEVVNQHNLGTKFPVSSAQHILKGSSVFIITLGLSEVWFNKNTGEVYKTAKSVGDYDKELHDFRVTTVNENFENIEYVYQSIRRYLKDAAVIFTLSPVPLKATFRDMSCSSANSISKAILRVALDTLFNKYGEDKQLHYFPSYELVLDFLPNPFGPDRRYIIADTVNFVMTLFANHYIVHEKC